MFERFTDRARRVIVLAQEEARGLGHGYVGTEHVLLGLLGEGEGVAAQALLALNLSLDDLRDRVLALVPKGDKTGAIQREFTPRAKRVMELSLREGLQLGHNYVGTEHQLLGLIREGEGIGAQVLVGAGADLSRVRQQVIHLLSGYTQSPPPTPPPTPAAMCHPLNENARIVILRGHVTSLAEERAQDAGLSLGSWVNGVILDHLEKLDKESWDDAS